MNKLRKVAGYYFLESKGNRMFGFFALIFYTLGFSLTELARPYVFKTIIDRLTDMTMTPLYAVGLFLTVNIVFNVFLRSADYSMVKFQSNMINSLFTSSVSKLLKHSSGFFTNSFTGKTIARVRRYSGSFESLFDELAYRVIVISLYVIGITIISFSLHFYLGIIVFCFISIMLIISFYFFKKKLVFDEKAAESESANTASLSDIINNIQTIIYFGKRDQSFREFQKVISVHVSNLYKTWIFGNRARILKAFLATTFEAVMIYSLVSFYNAGEITIGTVSLFISYMVSIANVMWSLDGSLKTISKATADAIEMIDIFETPIEITDSVSRDEISHKTISEKPSIVIENVSFTYPNGKVLFDNLSITIPSGQKVGICGTTGAGKTTLANLILRKMDTTSGRILLDDKSVKEDFHQDTLKEFIAYVPQMIELFNKTIMENIKFAKGDATDEEVIQAAKRARIHDFIISLDEGYNAIVGEKGTKLSGGQAQRIGIARAILKNAPILILDEATSALDVITETEILEILEKEFVGKTVLVIAHRLSTIRNLDRILVLNSGRVAQDGTHQELLTQKGPYADLISAGEQGVNHMVDEEIIKYNN
jgi:ATP-binding cassette subfamily B protein